jgi:hypothetical protein
VLERAHFSGYESLYRGMQSVDYVDALPDRIGDIQIYGVDGDRVQRSCAGIR